MLVTSHAFVVVACGRRRDRRRELGFFRPAAVQIIYPATHEEELPSAIPNAVDESPQLMDGRPTNEH